jgi:hypothetical protein
VVPQPLGLDLEVLYRAPQGRRPMIASSGAQGLGDRLHASHPAFKAITLGLDFRHGATIVPRA